MPKPKPNESQADFVSRCIPYLIREGKHPNTPDGRKAAAGECYGIYRNKSKDDVNESIEDLKSEIKDNREELEYLKQEMEDRQAQIGYLEHKINEKEGLIQKYDGDYEKIKEEISSSDDIEFEINDIIEYDGKVGKIVKVIN